MPGGDRPEAARIPGVPPTLEQRTMRKVSARLLPLVIATYFVAYIDRTNISFAALQMNRDLGLTATLFGWGSGIFFIGYFIFEIPSNLILHRTGARVWIARIMATWGLVLASMALVRGPVSLLVLRFLLGVAEAGFFPGMVLYLTFWFPAAYRARALAALCLAMPASNTVSAAVSGAILQLDGLGGLAGWKWIFILEALPALALAGVVWGQMTDRPGKAKWLAPEERSWLEAELERERAAIGAAEPSGVGKALLDRRVLFLTAIYFANNIVSYSISFFLPQIVKALGLSNLSTGFVTAIPFAISTGAMVLWSLSSDRRNERRWHFALAFAGSAAGLFGLGLAHGFLGSLFWMTLAAAGLYATKPLFWALPSLFLQGRQAAAGIALVNSVGNLGGLAGPYVFGWARDHTGSYGAGLYFLGACALLGAGAVLVFLRRSPAPPPCPLLPSTTPESSRS